MTISSGSSKLVRRARFHGTGLARKLPGEREHVSWCFGIYPALNTKDSVRTPQCPSYPR